MRRMVSSNATLPGLRGSWICAVTATQRRSAYIRTNDQTATQNDCCTMPDIDQVIKRGGGTGVPSRPRNGYVCSCSGDAAGGCVGRRLVSDKDSLQTRCPCITPRVPFEHPCCNLDYAEFSSVEREVVAPTSIIAMLPSAMMPHKLVRTPRRRRQGTLRSCVCRPGNLTWCLLRFTLRDLSEFEPTDLDTYHHIKLR